jgi:hypothetical protein
MFVGKQVTILANVLLAVGANFDEDPLSLQSCCSLTHIVLTIVQLD